MPMPEQGGHENDENNNFLSNQGKDEDLGRMVDIKYNITPPNGMRKRPPREEEERPILQASKKAKVIYHCPCHCVLPSIMYRNQLSNPCRNGWVGQKDNVTYDVQQPATFIDIVTHWDNKLTDEGCFNHYLFNFVDHKTLANTVLPLFMTNKELNELIKPAIEQCGSFEAFTTHFLHHKESRLCPCPLATFVPPMNVVYATSDSIVYVEPKRSDREYTVKRAHDTMAFHIISTTDAKELQQFTTENVRATATELAKSLSDTNKIHIAELHELFTLIKDVLHLSEADVNRLILRLYTPVTSFNIGTGDGSNHRDIDESYPVHVKNNRKQFVHTLLRMPQTKDNLRRITLPTGSKLLNVDGMNCLTRGLFQPIEDEKELCKFCTYTKGPMDDLKGSITVPFSPCEHCLKNMAPVYTKKLEALETMVQMQIGLPFIDKSCFMYPNNCLSYWNNLLFIPEKKCIESINSLWFESTNRIIGKFEAKYLTFTSNDDEVYSFYLKDGYNSAKKTVLELSFDSFVRKCLLAHENIELKKIQTHILHTYAQEYLFFLERFYQNVITASQRGLNTDVSDQSQADEFKESYLHMAQFNELRKALHFEMFYMPSDFSFHGGAYDHDRCLTNPFLMHWFTEKVSWRTFQILWHNKPIEIGVASDVFDYNAPDGYRKVPRPKNHRKFFFYVKVDEVKFVFVDILRKGQYGQNAKDHYEFVRDVTATMIDDELLVAVLVQTPLLEDSSIGLTNYRGFSNFSRTKLVLYRINMEGVGEINNIYKTYAYSIPKYISKNYGQKKCKVEWLLQHNVANRKDVKLEVNHSDGQCQFIITYVMKSHLMQSHSRNWKQYITVLQLDSSVFQETKPFPRLNSFNRISATDLQFSEEKVDTFIKNGYFSSNLYKLPSYTTQIIPDMTVEAFLQMYFFQYIDQIQKTYFQEVFITEGRHGLINEYYFAIKNITRGAGGVVHFIIQPQSSNTRGIHENVNSKWTTATAAVNPNQRLLPTIYLTWYGQMKNGSAGLLPHYYDREVTSESFYQPQISHYMIKQFKDEVKKAVKEIKRSHGESGNTKQNLKRHKHAQKREEEQLKQYEQYAQELGPETFQENIDKLKASINKRTYFIEKEKKTLNYYNNKGKKWVNNLALRVVKKHIYHMKHGHIKITHLPPFGTIQNKNKDDATTTSIYIPHYCKRSTTDSGNIVAICRDSVRSCIEDKNCPVFLYTHSMLKTSLVPIEVKYNGNEIYSRYDRKEYTRLTSPVILYPFGRSEKNNAI